MDDFDTPPEPDFDGPPPAAAKSRSRTWLVLAIVGGAVALGMVLCCGGGIWFFGAMFTEVPQAKAAADSFLKDLQADRRDQAYARTSSGFQATTSPAAFRKLLNTIPVLTDHNSRTIRLTRMYRGTTGYTATFQVSFQEPNGACTLLLLKENGAWKVHGINVSFSDNAAAEAD